MPIEVPDTRAFADPPPRRRRAAAAPVPPAAAPGQPAPAGPVVVEQTAADSAFRKPPVRRKRAPAVAEPLVAEPVVAEALGDEREPDPQGAPPPAGSAFSRPVRRRPKTRVETAEDTAFVDASLPAGAPPPAAAPRGPVGEERRGTEGAVEEVVQLTDTVVVRLNGTRYAVAMEAVAEVGRPPHVTRVPGVPTWIAGVANWRGRILPVLDLRVLLGAPTPELGLTGRVMVLARDGVTLAFLAERVEGVVSLEMDKLEPVLLTLSRTTASVLSGQLTHPDGPIAVLDLDTLFSLRTQLPRVRRAG